MARMLSSYIYVNIFFRKITTETSKNKRPPIYKDCSSGICFIIPATGKRPLNSINNTSNFFTIPHSFQISFESIHIAFPYDVDFIFLKNILILYVNKVNT